MFLHNGTNGPDSKAMCMFRLVCHVGAPEAKSAVSDFILLV